jgi:hypothetical protein
MANKRFELTQEAGPSPRPGAQGHGMDWDYADSLNRNVACITATKASLSALSMLRGFNRSQAVRGHVRRHQGLS